MNAAFRARILWAWLLAIAGVGPLHALDWERGWDGTSTLRSPGSALDTNRIEAGILRDSVHSEQSADAALLAWRSIAEKDPGNPEPWIELASLHLLKGAGYLRSKSGRLTNYKAALTACERAMVTNPEFARRVRSGEAVWEAAEALSAAEQGAMHFWVTGIFYIFRDCLGPMGRIWNARWMKATPRMLNQMDAIDPQWGGHASTFSRGIYYLAMPRLQGGDREKARAAFNRAVEAAPEWTVARWARGKYFHPAMKDFAAARADLQVVAEMPLRQADGSDAWNRYIQEDASRLLRSYERRRLSR